MREGEWERRASHMFAVVSVSGVVNCGHLRDACSAAQLGRIILIRFIKSVVDVD